MNERTTNRKGEVPGVQPGLLSVPRARQPLSKLVGPLSSELRRAAAIVYRGLSKDSERHYMDAFAPRDAGVASTPPDRSRVSWALVGTWAVARIALGPNKCCNFLEAENFFFGSIPLPHLSGSVRPESLEAAAAVLAPLPWLELRDLLPYALDPHEAGSRRQVLRYPETAGARRFRKQAGRFYTPSDVADHMVDWAVGAGENVTMLDPACGTGVFLLAAARRLLADGRSALETCRSLFGIDVDPAAIDAACFSLTAQLISELHSLAPAQLWHLIRLNLAERDALSILKDLHVLVPDDLVAQARYQRGRIRDSILEGDLQPNHVSRLSWSDPLRLLFPEVRDGFAAVVANPPYAPLGSRPDLTFLATRSLALERVTVTAETNAFIPFMEFMWTVARPISRSCMVVPMSIAYSQSKASKGLRQAMQAARGEWAFRFFDRTPDSIFGDDVKQRVAIVSREATGSADGFRMMTSGIQRWTSNSRHRLFTDLPSPVPLVPLSISDGIPKLNHVWERDLYGLTRQVHARLGSFLSYLGNDERAGTSLSIGSTAYNRLSVYLEPDRIVSAVNSHQYRTKSRAISEWAYAVLTSRLTYWLWRVEGDGFHVHRGFVENLPYSWNPNSPEHDELASLGRRLWTLSISRPVRSVNGGRETISFSPSGFSELDYIDHLLLRSLGLPTRFANEIKRLVISNVVVGRHPERVRVHGGPTEIRK